MQLATVSALHYEIVDFVQLLQCTEKELEQRNEAIRRLAGIVRACHSNIRTNIHVTVFGSFASGLAWHASDVDIMIEGICTSNVDGCTGGAEYHLCTLQCTVCTNTHAVHTHTHCTYTHCTYTHTVSHTTHTHTAYTRCIYTHTQHTHAVYTHTHTHSIHPTSQSTHSIQSTRTQEGSQSIIQAGSLFAC